MSIINHFLSLVIEPQFKLARDLTAMAIADGKNSRFNQFPKKPYCS